MHDQEATCERRERALQQLAQHGLGAEAPDGGASSAIEGGARPFTPRTRQPSMRTALLASFALLVIAVGAFGVYRLRAGQPTSISPPGPAQLTASLLAAGLSCPSDAAWSPDGAHLALLGHAQDATCFDVFNTRPQQGLLVLYDVAADKLTKQKAIQPDSAILARIPIGPDVQRAFEAAHLTASVGLDYQRALWSPDGHQLAVVFVAYVPSGSPSVTGGLASWPTNPLAGLALFGSDGTLARIVTSPLGGYDGVWDLSGGTYGRLPSAVAPGLPFTLPSALRYRWSGGDLTPQQPLSRNTVIDTGAAAPVGVPASGNDFALWQPGIATLQTQNAQNAVETPGIYVWETETFAAWSADGRYLAPYLHERALLVPLGQAPPSERQRGDFGLQAEPLAAPRDAALQKLLAAMPTSSYDPFAQSLTLAWRPDGRYLAALPSPQYQNAAGYTVTLYDTVTGRQVATLSLPAVYGEVGGGMLLLRWSADGRHLLLESARVGIVVVWGPPRLPA